VNYEPPAPDVGVSCGDVGVIAGAMESRVDVIFIQDYFLRGMRDPQVSNMRPVPLLSRGVVSWMTLNGVILPHGLVESTRVVVLSDMSRWVNHHSTLVLTCDVTDR